MPTRDHGIPDELSHAMGALSEATMKGVALEMNLSETAFLTTRPPGQDFATATDFHLRWFTPKVEVPLCGHVRAPDLGRSAGNGQARRLTSLPMHYSPAGAMARARWLRQRCSLSAWATRPRP